MNSEEKTNTEPTFEQAYDRLEQITRELDNDSVGLERSFELFEESQRLLKLCQNMLDKAEKKLKLLQIKDNTFEIQEEQVE